MKRFLLFCTVLSFLSACTLNTKRTQIRQIDKIDFEIKFLEHSIRTLKTDSIQMYVRNINKSLEVINRSTKKIYDDEFNTQYIIPFSDAGNLFNNYPTFLKNILGEILKSKNQIANLKTDVKKGIIKNSDFKEYLSEEKKAVGIINEDIKTLNARLQFNILLYNRIRPVIDKKIEKIKI